MQSRFARLIEKAPALCGMVHLRALPGTPRYGGFPGIVAQVAADEARTLAREGFDAILIENMHDAPYVRGPVGPEIVAAMTAAAIAVRQAVGDDFPLGIQVLAGSNREALAVALACDACFVRVEGFVFAHVGDEGTHEACAGELLRYRRAIGAERVAVLADIKKKHSSHAITADVDLAETAEAAAFFGADGVIVTGTATGRPAALGDLRAVRDAVGIPVAIGSGVTPTNMADYADAQMLIVGSALKQDGLWDAELDVARVREMAAAVRVIRA